MKIVMLEPFARSVPQKCYNDLESSATVQHRLQSELGSMESDHRLVVTEYLQRIEELSVELRTLQVVIEDQRGSSDEAAQLSLQLEKEKGRLAG